MSLTQDMCVEIKNRIEQAIPEAVVDVLPGSPGHYEIKAFSPAFAGLTAVKQQQLVYAAIKDLMAGDQAAVHAIDRMDLRAS